MGAEQYRVERQETMAVRAERVVVEEMRRRRWDETELERRALRIPARFWTAAVLCRFPTKRATVGSMLALNTG